MNHVTRHIMARYNMNLDEAEAVQDILEGNGIDFSECTMLEMDEEITIAHAQYIANLMKQVEVYEAEAVKLPAMKVTWHPAK